jgi:hypothetical protein
LLCFHQASRIEYVLHRLLSGSSNSDDQTLVRLLMIVFLRMRLDQDVGLFGCTFSPPCGASGHIWPTTNAEIRDVLVTKNDKLQNLFAMDLETGALKFIPAVGYGGTEDFYPEGSPAYPPGNPSGRAFMTTGPLPVVKSINGKQVAYIHFRNGSAATNGTVYDGRWDSSMGEMVLDNTTIPNLVAGDMRFVQMNKIDQGGGAMTYLVDEQNPVTMAGNTLFHSHWGAAESVRIINRANNLGLTRTAPIQTSKNGIIIRRLNGACSSANVNFVTRVAACNEFKLASESRSWDVTNLKSFFVYYNVLDPPTPVLNPRGDSAYSDGMRPRYTYVTAGSGNTVYIVAEGNGGELTVLQATNTP